MTVDASELRGLASDLAKASATLPKRMNATTFKAAMNVRDGARERIRGHKTLPRYPYSITFDLEADAAGLTAEIGPEEGGQGSLGHLVEWGTATSGPNPHLFPALDVEEPVWTDYVADIAADIV